MPFQEESQYLTLKHLALPFNMNGLRILQLAQLKVEGEERKFGPPCHVLGPPCPHAAVEAGPAGASGWALWVKVPGFL